MKPMMISGAPKDYRAESDLQTLLDAQEICYDKKRHKAALDLAQAKKEAMDELQSEADEENAEPVDDEKMEKAKK